jgi:hypothetical protein
VSDELPFITNQSWAVSYQCVEPSTPSMRRPVGVKSILFWLREALFFSRRVATVAMLPSALSRSESFRSVHVGRSRFSRCCHLINDLRFILRMKVGLALDAVTGTRL